MNTLTVTHTSPTDTTHSDQTAPVVRKLPPVPVGSEDVTVRRDMPVHTPKIHKPSKASATPVIRFKHVLVGVMLASMVGCGTTSGDRVVSGAGIGAGAGAIVGAVTGIGPGTGAAIGAAAGAATGGLTSKKQVNLGRPIWH